MTCPRCKSVSESGSRYCCSCGLPFDKDTIAGARFAPVSGFAGGLRPVGFWARLFALIVDRLIVGGLSLIVSLLIVGFLSLAVEGDVWGTRVFIGVLVVIEITYYTVGVSKWSTTVGKRMIGAYVLHPDGSQVGFLRAARRWLAYTVSALPLYGGFIMVGFRDDKRALHDLICDTVVVYRDR